MAPGQSPPSELPCPREDCACVLRRTMPFILKTNHSDLLSSSNESWLILCSVTLAMAPEYCRRPQALGMQRQTAHVSFIQVITGTTARPCKSNTVVSESRQGCCCHPNFQRQRETCHSLTAVQGKWTTVMLLSCCWVDHTYG